MNLLKLILPIISLPFLTTSSVNAEEVFEFNVGGKDGSPQSFTILPEVYLNLTGSLLDSDTPVSSLATSEHDPQKDYQLHPIEIHIDSEIGENITGLVYGIALQDENDNWETTIEEAKITYAINETLSIGGGQFLNKFGFQNKAHVHMRDFVNQNLQNSRLLSDGELITRGIELDYKPNSRWSFNVAAGKARLHDHDHGDHDDHGEEHHDDHEGEDHDDHEGEDHDDHEGEDHDDHEGEDHDDHDEHHMEADGINISDWIAST
ncbi:MAG: hypothetical protein VXW02_03765, partial [Verrucomicrobiota bacterium]|nr:hypothetical protein [Verrucomicrobiota bacterium]